MRTFANFAEFEAFAAAERAANSTAILVCVGGTCVYDATSFAPSHPGGLSILQQLNGKDATRAFAARHHHSSHARKLLEGMQIGEIIIGTSATEFSGGISPAAIVGRQAESSGATVAVTAGEHERGVAITEEHTDDGEHSHPDAYGKLHGLPLPPHLHRQYFQQTASSSDPRADRFLEDRGDDDERGRARRSTNDEAMEYYDSPEFYDNGMHWSMPGVLSEREVAAKTASGAAGAPAKDPALTMLRERDSLHNQSEQRRHQWHGMLLNDGIRQLPCRSSMQHTGTRLSTAEPQTPQGGDSGMLKTEWLDTSGTRGHGAAWHDRRRRLILQHHKRAVGDEIVRRFQYFPLTLAIGLACALFHHYLIFYWLPEWYVAVFTATDKNSATAGGGGGSGSLSASSTSFIPTVLAYIVAHTHTSFRLWIFTSFLFVTAYTIGAVLKMVTFGVGHEIAHETVHPLISCNSMQGSSSGGNDGPTDSLTSWLYVIKFALKDLSLRLCTLPSFGNTIFEYYHNQHLSHHENLGNLEFGESLRGLLDGSQSGDGDQLSVNTLLFTQRVEAPVVRDFYGRNLYQEYPAKVLDNINVHVAQTDRHFQHLVHKCQVEGDGGANAVAKKYRLFDFKSGDDEFTNSVADTERKALLASSSDDDDGESSDEHQNAENGQQSSNKVKKSGDTAAGSYLMSTLFGVGGRRRSRKRMQQIVVKSHLHYIFQTVNSTAIFRKYLEMSTTQASSSPFSSGGVSSSSGRAGGSGGGFSLFQMLANHPIITKVMFDPLFHLGHLGLMLISSAISMGIAVAWSFALFCLVIPGTLIMKFSPVAGGKRLARLGDYAASKHRALFRLSTLKEALKGFWPQASCGIQAFIWIFYLVRMLGYYSTVAAAVVQKQTKWQRERDGLSVPAMFCFSLFYLVLSELFVFGFMFHPFLAYFLSVHQSANTGNGAYKKDGAENNAGSSRDRKKVCQPTRSIYSKWFSLLTFNLNHHTEHHDFPSVPWFYLPAITKAAPEFYGFPPTASGASSNVTRGYLEDREELLATDDEDVRPEGRQTSPSLLSGGVMDVVNLYSPLGIIYDYLISDDVYVYACCDC